MRLAFSPGEGAGLKVHLVRRSRLLGVRVELADPDHRIVAADQLGARLALQHRHEPFVGGAHAPVGTEDQHQQPRVRDDKARLPLLPGKANERRREDIDRQECQQQGEPGAAVHIVLGRGGSMAGLDEGCERERGGQRQQAEDGQFQRGEKPVDRVNAA